MFMKTVHDESFIKRIIPVNRVSLAPHELPLYNPAVFLHLHEVLENILLV
jgi:hypothetical protein